MKTFLKRHFIFILILIVLLGGMSFSYANEGVIYSLLHGDTQETIAFLESFGVLAWVVFVFLVVLEVVLAPIPPLILYVVAGILFGGFLGGVLTLLGNLIGAYIDFMITRKLGQKRLEKKTNKKLQKKFNRFFDKYGGAAIFLLRVNPLTTSDLVSYLSGLTKIRTSTFLFATGLGLIPMIFLQTYLGDALIKGNPLLMGITLVVSLVYLVVFVYLIVLALSKKKS